jgi:hypothetical protein
MVGRFPKAVICFWEILLSLLTLKTVGPTPRSAPRRKTRTKHAAQKASNAVPSDAFSTIWLRALIRDELVRVALDAAALGKAQETNRGSKSSNALTVVTRMCAHQLTAQASDEW